MEQNDDHALLTEWLQKRGHTPDEIVKIMERVQRYDQEMNADSVMDSIGSGRLNLDAIIKEALGQ